MGEIFLTDIGKEGSTLRGMMNAFATSVSISLQYGVPLETLVRKFSYMRFDPEGITTNPEIPFAKSMPDYIMRWLASRFLDAEIQEELGILTPEVRARKMQEEALLRGDAPEPRRGNGGGNGHAGNGGGTATRPATAEAPRLGVGPGSAEAGSVSADGRAPGHPGEAAGPRPGPGLRPVRRHDAAHRQLLHVQQLREQHRLRVAASARCAGWRLVGQPHGAAEVLTAQRPIATDIPAMNADLPFDELIQSPRLDARAKAIQGGAFVGEDEVAGWSMLISAGTPAP